MANNKHYLVHHKRVRERFLQHDLDNFQNYEALEFLLFLSIPRRDTSQLHW